MDYQMQKVNDILEWIIKCGDIYPAGSTGSNRKLLSFELMPRDFLRFAAEDLESSIIKNKVSLMSNLKRALECQLDIFFDCIHMKEIFDRNNVKFEQRIQLLSDIGMLPNKTIKKLNEFRNQLECFYQIPSVGDLEMYYELVWNVVEIMNLNMNLMIIYRELHFNVRYSEKEYLFTMRYDFERTGFVFCIKNKNTEEEFQLEIILHNQEQYQEYIKAYHLYRIIIEYNNFMEIESFIERLSELKKENQ